MTQGHAHVALIVPASNTVMEPDFHRALGDSVTVSTWRIHLDNVTREAEERMLSEELPRCLGHLAPTRPALVVFGCTSAGALDGLHHDVGIRRRIGAATGGEVVTVVSSMISEFDALGVRRVALFTPYAPELTESIVGCVNEAGYEVVRSVGMGIVDNREIGAVDPDAIRSFVREGMEGLEADAVFLSCTNWRSLEAIGPLTEELGVPVLTSNKVTLRSVHRRMAVL